MRGGEAHATTTEPEADTHDARHGSWTRRLLAAEVLARDHGAAPNRQRGDAGCISTIDRAGGQPAAVLPYDMVRESRTARVARRKAVTVPAPILDRVVETLHPEQVWLFGSRARGDYRPDSDWDILAVVPDDTPDAEMDLVETWKRLRDLRLLRVEVFPVRRVDFEQEQHSLGTLCQIARSEGKLVYAA